LEPFVASARERNALGQGLPAFVERELRAYLDCGILARPALRGRHQPERPLSHHRPGRGIRRGGRRPAALRPGPLQQPAPHRQPRLDHDDREREFAYESVSGTLKEQEPITSVATRLGCTVISMANDWSRVFAG